MYLRRTVLKVKRYTVLTGPLTWTLFFYRAAVWREEHIWLWHSDPRILTWGVLYVVNESKTHKKRFVTGTMQHHKQFYSYLYKWAVCEELVRTWGRWNHAPSHPLRDDWTILPLSHKFKLLGITSLITKTQQPLWWHIAALNRVQQQYTTFARITMKERVVSNWNYSASLGR